MKFLNKIRTTLKGIHIPFLEVSLWKMFEIYVEGLIDTPVIRQASAVSWNFFLSLFPFLLFMLSILPYLPHYEKLEHYIFEVVMTSAFPAGIRHSVTSYVQDVFLPNLQKINNTFTIILTLFFGALGTKSLINSFNLNTDRQRPFFKELWIALLIAIAFATLAIASLLGIYYAEVVTKLFNPIEGLSWIAKNLTALISFVSFPIFYFVLMALLYWVGCLKIVRFREAIPGALLSTILFGLVTYGFAIYVKGFARYNLWYGSIGSILLVMIWVNINIILILFGNQFNIAIRQEKIKHLEQKKIKLEEESIGRENGIHTDA